MVAYLNIHTAYDLLNSSLKIEDAVRLAVSENVDALAITDTNVLYGFPKFYDACIANNIKPIFWYDNICDKWIKYSRNSCSS